MVLAALSGGLLIIIFPKFSLYPLAYFALIPLFAAIKKARSMDEAAFCGFLCGFIFMSGTLYWINILSKWAGPWANLAWISLAFFQALFFAFFAATSKYLYTRRPTWSMIIFPASWVAVEWVRSLGPYGVTGGGLGYSQADFLLVLQLASVFGVYGISFFVAFINEALDLVLMEKKWNYFVLAAFLSLLVFTFGYYRVSTFKCSGKPLTVAVIQANVDQDVKLDYGFSLEISIIHEGLSRKALAFKPDIVIWPETAITTYLFQSNTILKRITSLVKESRAFYLIGTPYRDGEKIYNSVAAFSKEGKYIGRYDKQRLVPFGEYLPLRPLFYRLLQENPLFAEDYNSNPKPGIINLNGIKIGTVICFESTFPHLVRKMAKKGAQFILVTTNDAWFFDSAALYQHIQAAQLRAVENHMYVVQAANTGISAVIDPIGKIVKRSEAGKPTILIGEIYVH